MAVRAVRGATQLEDDVREHMLERVAEMVTDVMDANGLDVDDFISVIFTATSDLVSEFPAYAARRLGFGDVPLICARELEIEGSMPRVVRMLAHVETDLPEVRRSPTSTCTARSICAGTWPGSARSPMTPDGPGPRRRCRPARHVDRARPAQGRASTSP